MKNTNYVYAIIIISGVFISCSSPEPEGNVEKEIYSGIINNALQREEDTLKITADDYLGFEWRGVEQIILLEDSEYTVETFKNLQKKLFGLERSTYNNFKRRNKQSIKVIRYFDTGEVPISSLSDQNIKDIFEDQNGWEGFYQKFYNSQGILFVSRIGFNKDENQALVYLQNQSADLEGIGYYLLLEKENGIWLEKSIIVTWMS